jgi:hypothetical protein
MKSFLLDLILFGNPDNLVNINAPFEKFIVDDLMESKEYLASRHYSQSYDLCINDVDGPPPSPCDSSVVLSSCNELGCWVWRVAVKALLQGHCHYLPAAEHGCVCYQTCCQSPRKACIGKGTSVN